MKIAKYESDDMQQTSDGVVNFRELQATRGKVVGGGDGASEGNCAILGIEH